MQINDQKLRADLTLDQVIQAEETWAFIVEDDGTQQIHQVVEQVKANLKIVNQVQNQLTSLPKQEQIADLASDIGALKR